MLKRKLLSFLLATSVIISLVSSNIQMANAATVSADSEGISMRSITGYGVWPRFM